MGRLMVIDGLDGCGKTTQLRLLHDRLKQQGKAFRLISFPDYDQPSSTLVKMYLGGEFGTEVDSVNAYAASSFYAVDRYASFRLFWQKEYEKDVPVIAARYTTSNAIHQMTKLPTDQWDDYLSWLEDYEYSKLGLPRPDAVVFLDMPPEVSRRQVERRYEGDDSKKDIHERDEQYLEHCRKAALYAADRLGWIVLPCSDGENPLSREAIHESLFEVYRNKMQTRV